MTVDRNTGQEAVAIVRDALIERTRHTRGRIPGSRRKRLLDRPVCACGWFRACRQHRKGTDMSINTVYIVPAEERYSPPNQVIELAVLGDSTDQLVHQETPDGKNYYKLEHARKLVLLSLSDYEETSDGSTTKRTIEFPAIDLNDLLRALSSFGVGVQSFHVGEPPVRLPAPPAALSEGETT